MERRWNMPPEAHVIFTCLIGILTIPWIIIFIALPSFIAMLERNKKLISVSENDNRYYSACIHVINQISEKMVLGSIISFMFAIAFAVGFILLPDIFYAILAALTTYLICKNWTEPKIHKQVKEMWIKHNVTSSLFRNNSLNI